MSGVRRHLKHYGVYITWDSYACDPVSNAIIELPSGGTVTVRRESTRSDADCTGGSFSTGSDKFFLITDGSDKKFSSFTELMEQGLGLSRLP